MSEDLFRALFDRPAIYRAIDIMAPRPEERAAELLMPTYGRAYYSERPNVGPRGGQGNRAKTKAARKANLRRRQHP